MVTGNTVLDFVEGRDRGEKRRSVSAPKRGVSKTPAHLASNTHYRAVFPIITKEGIHLATRTARITRNC